MRVSHLAALVMATALVQGCTPTPNRVETAPPAPDLYGRSRAAVCRVTPISLKDGGESVTTMTMVNDGGYCAIALSDSAGKPFEVGLVTAAPQRGKPLVHTVGAMTDIDYTPNPGFIGSDSFVVRLRTAAVDSLLHVTVIVTAPGNAASAGQPAPPNPGSIKTPPPPAPRPTH